MWEQKLRMLRCLPPHVASARVTLQRVSSLLPPSMPEPLMPFYYLLLVPEIMAGIYHIAAFLDRLDRHP